MSLVIANGFRVHPMSATELWQWTRQVSRMMVMVQDDVILDRLSSVVGRMMDRLRTEPGLEWIHQYDFYRPAEPSDSVIHTAREWIEWQSTHRTDDREFDLTCSAVLYPLADDLILAQFYASDPKFRQVWDSLPEVTEYWYGDQADPDETVPDDEWTARRLAWKQVFTDAPEDLGIPESTGFVVNFTPSPSYRIYRVSAQKVAERLGLSDDLRQPLSSFTSPKSVK